MDSAPLHSIHKIQGTVLSAKELSKSVDLATSLLLDLHLRFATCIIVIQILYMNIHEIVIGDSTRSVCEEL